MLDVLDAVNLLERTADVVWGEWSCCAQPAGSITTPHGLTADICDWISVTVPGTVAAALQTNGIWNWDQPADIDTSDWWFRTTFQAPSRPIGEPCQLCFDGLATLADVWLNGRLLLSTDNMFRSYRVNVASGLQAENELCIRFHSLTEELKAKKPRPRWKTNLVQHQHQQLRWLRTSLQGRIPGWSPAAPAIGPWRDVHLQASPVLIDDLQLHASLDETRGIVTIQARLIAASTLDAVRLHVGAESVALDIHSEADGWLISGELQVDHPTLWWPHTHGKPHLYDCSLSVVSGETRYTLPCTPLGFRKLTVDSNDQFGIRINDEPIYCRGACWTVGDLTTFNGTESLRHDLQLARDAGANMLRISGTMIYESDRFYQLCDELGILIWQDFMFANMDYPVDDPTFRQNILTEATQQVRRLASHPCIAVYCGNSEVEQQAAMLGMPREIWRNDWFAEQLPQLCNTLHPNSVYLPSTPTGGVLPFHASTGVTHYYGIGAYLRSISDLRQADVKFTSECLGFANVPDPQTLELIADGASPVPHSPQWKRRVPRDTGAGWDFEDVRDHYLQHLFGVNPVELRSWDLPRYLQLSRIVTGEMMTQTFSEWRSVHSRNRGGLVWFFKDLLPAAGWGIVDSTGRPKAAYYYLKRSWSARQLTLTDEGLNGLHLHLINETASACDGRVEVTLWKEPDVMVARQSAPLQVSARSKVMRSADEILGGFYDVNYVYRFGPPHHDVAVATWYDAEDQIISEAFHFVRRKPAIAPANVVSHITKVSDAEYDVTVSTDTFLHGVSLQARGFLPDDNYFYLAPQRSKQVIFRAQGGPAANLKVDLEAINLANPIRITSGSKNTSSGNA